MSDRSHPEGDGGRGDRFGRPSRSNGGERGGSPFGAGRGGSSNRGRSPRDERSGERGAGRDGRSDYPYRGDRPERDRQGRDDRPNRDDRQRRDDRPYRENRQDRPYRGDRPNSGDRPYRRDRSGSQERDSRSYRGDRPDRDRQGRDDRPYRENRQDRDPRPYRGDRQDRPDRDGRPARTGRDARPALGRGGTRGGGRSDRGGSERTFTEAERLAHELRPVRAEHLDPELPDDVRARDLPPAARNELKTLQEAVQERVARHLAMVARLIDDDPELAHQHAISASRRAGRIPVARETLAITAYRLGDFALALRELRTHRRLSGSQGHIALMVDCERGLGRPERAIETGLEAKASELDPEQRVLLAIAMSGARLDLGQTQQALFELEIPELDPTRAFSWSPALFAAYANVLDDLGRDAEAAMWRAREREADAALTEHFGGDETVEVVEDFSGGERAERDDSESPAASQSEVAEPEAPRGVVGDTTSGPDLGLQSGGEVGTEADPHDGLGTEPDPQDGLGVEEGER